MVSAVPDRGRLGGGLAERLGCAGWSASSIGTGMSSASGAAVGGGMALSTMGAGEGPISDWGSDGCGGAPLSGELAAPTLCQCLFLWLLRLTPAI